jgi:hypothetical protein
MNYYWQELGWAFGDDAKKRLARLATCVDKTRARDPVSLGAAWGCSCLVIQRLNIEVLIQHLQLVGAVAAVVIHPLSLSLADEQVNKNRLLMKKHQI